MFELYMSIVALNMRDTLSTPVPTISLQQDFFQRDSFGVQCQCQLNG